MGFNNTSAATVISGGCVSAVTIYDQICICSDCTAVRFTSVEATIGWCVDNGFTTYFCSMLIVLDLEKRSISVAVVVPLIYREI
ncbi:hypothetical protein TSUD_171530 [Trifolium subterraneum]|uniref:Uncharacterized protein n=1 Tax=Trifolium subterraneum TaxID=3900 RepID=A0A2Z6LKL5_TRISU|nr:hypothetical protein TSUD_171530 [Trifolium subterraneum]